MRTKSLSLSVASTAVVAAALLAPSAALGWGGPPLTPGKLLLSGSAHRQADIQPRATSSMAASASPRRSSSTS